jgi:uncharacterized protein DUF6982/PilZ domain-containing protein
MPAVLSRRRSALNPSAVTGNPPKKSTLRSVLTLVARQRATSVPRFEAPCGATGADRRAYARVSVGDLPWVKNARLKYGAPLSLIDLSIGGAQVETAVTLRPGSTIVVQIQGEDRDIALASQVLRCRIAAIAPVATYRGALAFRRAIQLPGLAAASESIAPLDAAHEVARRDGFFVIPADPKSNNQRVFVVSRAIRHVQFL